jgi:hypothetical protein
MKRKKVRRETPVRREETRLWEAVGELRYERAKYDAGCDAIVRLTTGKGERSPSFFLPCRYGDGHHQLLQLLIWIFEQLRRQRRCRPIRAEVRGRVDEVMIRLKCRYSRLSIRYSQNKRPDPTRSILRSCLSSVIFTCMVFLWFKHGQFTPLAHLSSKHDPITP